MHSTIRTASAKAIRAAAVYPSLLTQSQLTRRNHSFRHQDVTLIRSFSTTRIMSGMVQLLNSNSADSQKVQAGNLCQTIFPNQKMMVHVTISMA